MNQHPEMWYIIIGLVGILGGFLSKMAFELIKNKSGDGRLLEVISVIDKRTALMDKNLDDGISVAKRNTESYHEFLIVLNDLKNMISNNTDVTKELVKEVKTQTVVLTQIKNNGNGKEKRRRLPKERSIWQQGFI